MTDHHYRASVTTVIEAYRPGWKGVWDALCAAITGNDRTTVPEVVRFSIGISAPAEPHDVGRMIRFRVEQGDEPLAMYDWSVTSMGDPSSYISTTPGARAWVGDHGSFSMEFTPPLSTPGDVGLKMARSAPPDIGEQGIEDWSSSFSVSGDAAEEQSDD
jgi:hypothetical protein